MKMIYLLIYIAAIVTALYIIELLKAVQNRRKNKELYEEKVQERAIQAEQVAGLVSEADYQLHQYKTYVIRSIRIDVGYRWAVFLNDGKTKLGSALEVHKTRDEAVMYAEAWIDDFDNNVEV